MVAHRSAAEPEDSTRRRGSDNSQREVAVACCMRGPLARLGTPHWLARLGTTPSASHTKAVKRWPKG
eukprot:366415-Chlamydomonas_euryale.AAC.6